MDMHVGSAVRLARHEMEVSGHLVDIHVPIDDAALANLLLDSCLPVLVPALHHVGSGNKSPATMFVGRLDVITGVTALIST